MNNLSQPGQGQQRLPPSQVLFASFCPEILCAGTQSILAVQMSLYLSRLSDGETYSAEGSYTHAEIRSTRYGRMDEHLPITYSRVHSLAYKRL